MKMWQTGDNEENIIGGDHQISENDRNGDNGAGAKMAYLRHNALARHRRLAWRRRHARMARTARNSGAVASSRVATRVFSPLCGGSNPAQQWRKTALAASVK